LHLLERAPAPPAGGGSSGGRDDECLTSSGAPGVAAGARDSLVAQTAALALHEAPGDAGSGSGAAEGAGAGASACRGAARELRRLCRQLADADGVTPGAAYGRHMLPLLQDLFLALTAAPGATSGGVAAGRATEEGRETAAVMPGVIAVGPAAESGAADPPRAATERAGGGAARVFVGERDARVRCPAATGFGKSSCGGGQRRAG
jgi:hypothetical protein